MLMDKNNMIIAEQRANISRNIEYLRAMTESSFVADRFLLLDTLNETYNESVDDMENKDIMDHMVVNGDEDKDEEIERILGSNSDMSLDEVMGIRQDIGSAYESAFMEDVFFEGVNMDYRKSKKILSKQVKPLITKMKKALKDHNYSDAKKYLSQAQKEFKVAKDMFEKTDRSLESESMKSTIISFFYDGLIDFLKILAASILTIPLLGLGGAVMGIYSSIEQLGGMIAGISKDLKNDNVVSAKSLNFVRNRTNFAFNTMENMLNKTAKLIDEIEKEAAKSVKNESTDDSTTSSSADTTSSSTPANAAKADSQLDKTIKDVEKSNDKDTSNTSTNNSSTKDTSLMTEDEIIDEMLDDILDDDLFEEGANKDLYDIRKKYIKPATKKLKSAKQMIKSGKTDAAIKMLNDVIKDMEAVKTVVKDMDDTSTDKLIGAVLVSWKSLATMIVSIIGMITGTAMLDASVKAGAILAGTSYAGLMTSMFASGADLQKAKDGAEKLLDKKMDNEGWQKALTESYNAYRTATYQMADDVINISKKMISDIKDGNVLNKIDNIRNK